METKGEKRTKLINKMPTTQTKSNQVNPNYQLIPKKLILKNLY